MDVLLQDASGTSAERVVQTDAVAVWRALISMGRPLWRHHIDLDMTALLPDAQRSVVQLAASKLLFGREIECASSYEESTMHGVSSLFCRTGLRPRASDVLRRVWWQTSWVCSTT